MLWTLILVLSARNGFDANIEGGVAITTVQVQSKDLCQKAAHDFLEVNGNRGFFASATCVETK